MDTLVHVQDLINVSGGQVLAIAHQVFVGGRVRIISAARRIVHDASVVIWGVTRVRVVLALVCGTNVGPVIGKVLGDPARVDVLPMHDQMRAMSIPCSLGVRTLLLMVHSNGMSNFVDHASNMAHAIAKPQVDSTVPWCIVPIESWPSHS